MTVPLALVKSMLGINRPDWRWVSTGKARNGV